MSEEHQITIDKPEKDPRKVEAGKKLAAFNKMARKVPKEPEHHEESTCDEEWMKNTTKTLLLAGTAAVLLFLHDNNSKQQRNPSKR